MAVHHSNRGLRWRRCNIHGAEPGAEQEKQTQNEETDDSLAVTIGDFL